MKLRDALFALGCLAAVGLGGLLIARRARGAPSPDAPAASTATSRAPAAPRVFESSAQCAPCHAQLFAEWRDSPHATTWNDPAVRALSNDFANTDCIDCHAPQPVFTTGIGQRVLPRSWRQSEGVDCLACHALPASEGGGVAARRTLPDAPCRPRERAELTQVELCAGCHDQHQTVQQWRASRWPALGFDCNRCHAESVERASGARGRRHAWIGTSLELVQRAVELRAHFEGAKVATEIENVGAGHSFPTDERSRAADLFWRPLPRPGETAVAWRHAYRFRSPYRYETALTDTTLAAHDTRRIEIAAELLDGVDALELAIFYKRSPHWAQAAAPDPEREASLVARVEVRRP